MERADVAAVLLAAGASERMGSPKALLPWMGRALITYQLEQLRLAGARWVVVVLGHEAEEIRATVRLESTSVQVEVNHDWRSGVCSSIRAGVGACPPDAKAILIHAVDQPRRTATLRTVISTHLSGRQLVTVPTCGGRRGHPPVLSAALRADLLSLSEGRQGLREVMRRHASMTVEVPAGPEVLLNVNTWEEYQRALSGWEENMQGKHPAWRGAAGRAGTGGEAQGTA